LRISTSIIVMDRRNTGLVVGAEQRCSVGGNDVIAQHLLENGFCATVITCDESVGSTMSPP
jgi:hypothetical protein